ncbi:dipeptide ABC transporter ATP-binding protein [Conexibacter sp. S30A1]|uniref:ABC transporter ATP-binding protein n=1 Tax=Conexibacter sp. S30A1 TaxID=2937800 RepID=UPI003530EA90
MADVPLAVNGGRKTKALGLEVSHLEVCYRVRGVDLPILRDVSFEIDVGESFGLVGESGCGKSTAVQAITSYLARNGKVTGGQVLVRGRDIARLGKPELRELRARDISVVYQEPGRALTPSVRIGHQVAEVFRVLGASKMEAMQRARDALDAVQIPDGPRVMGAYPHELSGGMLQRVVIAMAIASEPTLLILDEPTTALDATVEAEVLELVASLRQRLVMSTLFISHNLAVISKMCDRVAVMYAGEIVEQGLARDVLERPQHPYTVGLLRCIPKRTQRKDRDRLDTIPGFLPEPGLMQVGCVFAPRCALADDGCRADAPPVFDVGKEHLSRCFKHREAESIPRIDNASRCLTATPAETEPLVRLERVSKTFPGRKGGRVSALNDIDIELYAGDTLGVVGESGCGKTTLARILLGLTAPDPGSRVEIRGEAAAPIVANRSREQLKLVQIIFQNPDAALNRRHSVGRIIGRAVTKLGGLKGGERQQRIADVVGSVRLEPRHLAMRPAQLSGGLKQRVAIARAYAGSPSVLVCDEPTSALDVSVQAAILNLLVDLQQDEHIAYVFISHDLGVVRYLADRVLVLYLGRVMEYGPAAAVFAGPHHPYTEALLSAVPTLDQKADERIKLTGEIPSPSEPPTGCVFNTRCQRRLPDGKCSQEEPPLRELAPGRAIRCHLSLESLGTAAGQ